MSVVTRPAALSDSKAIADIYNYYIRETVVTFDEQEITAAEMVAGR
jgi:L-amino acid N-acyltransferase YncA